MDIKLKRPETPNPTSPSKKLLWENSIYSDVCWLCSTHGVTGNFSQSTFREYVATASRCYQSLSQSMSNCFELLSLHKILGERKRACNYGRQFHNYPHPRVSLRVMLVVMELRSGFETLNSSNNCYQRWLKQRQKVHSKPCHPSIPFSATLSC